jgi:hypothetical protein
MLALRRHCDKDGAPVTEPTPAQETKPLGELLGELVSLVRAYVMQETVEPVKSLGRFVAFGVAGAMLMAVGGVLLALGAVRAAQGEAGAHLGGDLTWVPYAGGLIVAATGAGWAVSRISKRGHR